MLRTSHCWGQLNSGRKILLGRRNFWRKPSWRRSCLIRRAGEAVGPCRVKLLSSDPSQSRRGSEGAFPDLSMPRPPSGETAPNHRAPSWQGRRPLGDKASPLTPRECSGEHLLAAPDGLSPAPLLGLPISRWYPHGRKDAPNCNSLTAAPVTRFPMPSVS